MATLLLFANNPDYSIPFSTFHQAHLTKHSINSAAYVDEASGAHLYMRGRHFEFLHGELVGGSITSMLLDTPEGNRVSIIENISFDPNRLQDVTTDDWAAVAVRAMLKGASDIVGSVSNDLLQGYSGADGLFGSGGADIIRGGLGDDDLRGDALHPREFASDRFIFGRHDGHDTIEDFNAGGVHDVIKAKAESYTVHSAGHDTLIEFDTGVSVTLADFDKADLQAQDIHLM